MQIIRSSSLLQIFHTGLYKYFGTVKSKLVYDKERLRKWLNRRQLVETTDECTQNIIEAQTSLETRLNEKFTQLESKLAAMSEQFEKLDKLMEALQPKNDTSL